MSNQGICHQNAYQGRTSQQYRHSTGQQSRGSPYNKNNGSNAYHRRPNQGNHQQPQRPNKTFCRQVMEDTISRSQIVTTETKHASLDSFYYYQQLAPVQQDMCPKLTLKPIKFVADDTFAATRLLMDQNPDYRHNVAVLNMASDTILAGSRDIPTGFSQEGALCMSSTLYKTLHQQKHNYPWRTAAATTTAIATSQRGKSGNNNCACIYSPDVTIFKDSANNRYKALPLEQRKVVGVINIAAPQNSDGTQHGTLSLSKLEELREKIKMLCRMAIEGHKTVLVLGAMGCGVYHCPPKQVAEEMKRILTQEEEFNGWFEEIVFAIFDKKTCDVFQDVFRK